MTDTAHDLNDIFDIPAELIELPELSPPTPVLPNRWPPQLVFDLALGLEDNYEVLATRYDLTPQTIERLFTLPKFRQEVASLSVELRESNAQFKYKAKAQAETYLNDMDDLMNDRETPPSIKLAIFQAMTKLGDLEPKPEPQQLQNGLIPQGSSGRMIVEWVGGPQDHSPISEVNEEAVLIQ